MAENFCVEHQTVWFKKGAMKSYAHPVKDGSGVTVAWCNKPKTTESPEPPQVTVTKQLGAVAENVTTKIAPQEVGLWQKEVGEWLRSGQLHEWVESGKLNKTLASALNTQYWAKMKIALEITEEK